MEHNMSRILIETTVRQTLKGITENPKRSIRNLVDMALHFSEGRFQSRFFHFKPVLRLCCFDDFLRPPAFLFFCQKSVYSVFDNIVRSDRVNRNYRSSCCHRFCQNDSLCL